MRCTHIHGSFKWKKKKEKQSKRFLYIVQTIQSQGFIVNGLFYNDDFVYIIKFRTGVKSIKILREETLRIETRRRVKTEVVLLSKQLAKTKSSKIEKQEKENPITRQESRRLVLNRIASV